MFVSIWMKDEAAKKPLVRAVDEDFSGTGSRFIRRSVHVLS